MTGSVSKKKQTVGYSVIIPVKEINHYLRESVPRLLAMDYSEFEVIILPNDMAAGNLPDSFADPRIRVVATGRVSPAIKRDIGAQQAIHSRLAFLDDDAYPRSDWLREADAAFTASGAAAVGGPGVTPPDSSLAERASALFFESRLGGGGMAYRYRPVGRGFDVDDFPTVNLLVEKSAFDAVGGFDNEFWPGEDTKFCLDLKRAGWRIWYAPDVVVYHHRRRVLRPHLKQVGGYGKHRGYFARTLPETSLRLTYFVPSLFLLGSIALIALGFAANLFWKIYLGMMLVYLMMATIDVFSLKTNPVLGVLTVLTIYASHLTYGLMFLRGLLVQSSFHSTLR